MLQDMRLLNEFGRHLEDAKLGLRLAGAYCRAAGQYFFHGIVATAKSGAAMGAVLGALILLVATFTAPFELEEVFLGMPTAVLGGSVAGLVINVFVAPPLFLLASLFAPTEQKTGKARPTVLEEIERQLLRWQAGAGLFTGVSTAGGLTFWKLAVEGQTPVADAEFWDPITTFAVCNGLAGCVAGAVAAMVVAVHRARLTATGRTRVLERALDASQPSPYG